MKQYYLEYTVGKLSNRKKYDISNKVINQAFEYGKKFLECYQSLYLYNNLNPDEKDFLFGDFYMECDSPDFQQNKNTIVTLVDYLYKNLNINHTDICFFLTNKSLWIRIPSKIFGSYGSVNLHKIHKSMAKEINQYIINNNCYKIDLSIYKWNGLRHSIGSYLPKNKRWVKEFSYYELDKANTIKELYENIKYVSSISYDDFKTNETAKNFFLRHRNIVFNSWKENLNIINNTNNNHNNYLNYTKKVLEEILSNPLQKGYRNLTIYNIALICKGLNKTTKETREIIQNNYKNQYVYEKGCIRTIENAFKNKRYFSYKEAMIQLPFSISEPKGIHNDSESFIIPRCFIDKLNNEKCHYMCYKILIEILYNKQVNGLNYKLDISEEKYKKRVIDYFNTLKKLGFINFEIQNDIISSTLIYKENVYNNYIYITKSLMEKIKLMGKEVKLFLELCRSAYKIGENLLFTNIKKETIIKNLKTTKETFKMQIEKLKSMKLIFRNMIILSNFIKTLKDLMYKYILKNKELLKKNIEYIFGYNSNIINKKNLKTNNRDVNIKLNVMKKIVKVIKNMIPQKYDIRLD